jgi:hypothetical protein
VEKKKKNGGIKEGGDRLQKGESRETTKNMRKPLWGLDLSKQSPLFARVGETAVSPAFSGHTLLRQRGSSDVK